MTLKETIPEYLTDCLLEIEIINGDNETMKITVKIDENDAILAKAAAATEKKFTADWIGEAIREKLARNRKYAKMILDGKDFNLVQLVKNLDNKKTEKEGKEEE